MQGYQLTFFTVQDRRHGNMPLCEWLMQEAKKLGRGATLIAAAEGIGHDHKLHSAHFIDLADQPIQIMMALSDAETEHLFRRLHEEKINVFYTKMPIEFGMTEDI